jgi:hypothetical protein
MSKIMADLVQTVATHKNCQHVGLLKEKESESERERRERREK